MIVKTYDNLWKVDKRLYRIGDITLSQPPLYSQIVFFASGLLITVCVLYLFGALTYNSFLIKYVGMPLAFCLFMTKIKFDGKRPDRFLLSILRFHVSPHLLCRYQKLQKPKQYSFEGSLKRIVPLVPVKEQEKEGQEKKEMKEHGVSDTD